MAVTTAGIVMAGPWGGKDGGQWRFRLNAGERLTKIQICSAADGVYSIQFTYNDINNIQRESQVFGGPGGDPHHISLAENEIINGISGTFEKNYYRHITIASLSFKSNLCSYGPYVKPEGSQRATTFSLPVPRGNFVGFFGKCGSRLDSIGVMLKSGE